MRTLPNPLDAPPRPEGEGAALPPDAITRIDNGPILRDEIRDLQRRFGVLAWFGHHTRHWWALDEDRLAEGASPARLADAIMAARRRTR